MENDLPICNASECIYTRCFCEENVWKFCESMSQKSPDIVNHMDVVFISNSSRTVPLWQQLSRKADNDPVVWDYHVIAMFCNSNHCYDVYDLDSFVPFPCTFDRYITETFKPSLVLKPQFQHKLKVIKAKDYLQNFASDRSHMKNIDGTWQARPPHYPCISTMGSDMNLDDYINMDSGIGVVYTLQSFIRQYQHPAP